MQRYLMVMLLAAAAACSDGEAKIAACTDAMLEFDNNKSDAACDPLSHEDQEKAAKIASDKSGVIIFIPSYQAKEGRQQ